MRRVVGAYREAFRGLPREVWCLALVFLIGRAGWTVVPFLVLYLKTQLGFTVVTAGAFLSLYGVGGLSGVALGGWLTDRIGAYRVQVTSLFAGGSMFFVLMQLRSPVSIGVTIVVTAFLCEAFRPANSAAVAEFTAPYDRARAYGLQRLAVNLGWTVGPTFGGLLAMVDYGLLFVVNGVAFLAAGGALVALMHGRYPERKQGERPRGGRSPWRDGVFLVASSLMLLQGLVFFQLLSTFALYLREIRGFSEAKIGLVYAVNTIVIVIFEMLLMRWLQDRDKLRVIAFGLLFVGLGFGLLPFGASFVFVVFTVVVWTVGEMLAMPMATAFVADRSSEGNRGRYMGVFTMTFSLANIAAPLWGTAVYGEVAPDAVWYVGFVVCAACWVGFLLLARLTRSAPG